MCIVFWYSIKFLYLLAQNNPNPTIIHRPTVTAMEILACRWNAPMQVICCEPTFGLLSLCKRFGSVRQASAGGHSDAQPD